MEEETKNEVQVSEESKNSNGNTKGLKEVLKERLAGAIKRNNEKKEKESVGKKKGISIRTGIALTFATLSLLTSLTTVGYLRDFESKVVTTADVASVLIMPQAKELLEEQLNITIGDEKEQMSNIQEVSNVGQSIYSMVKAYIGREDLSLEEVNTVLALNGVEENLLKREDGTYIDLSEVLEVQNNELKNHINGYDLNATLNDKAIQIGEMSKSQKEISTIVEACKIASESMYSNVLRSNDSVKLEMLENCVNEILENSTKCKTNENIFFSLKANTMLEFAKSQIANSEFDELLESRKGREFLSKVHDMGGFVGKLADKAYDTFGPVYDTVKEAVGPVITEFIEGVADVDSKLGKRVNIQDEIE